MKNTDEIGRTTHTTKYIFIITMHFYLQVQAKKYTKTKLVQCDRQQFVQIMTADQHTVQGNYLWSPTGVSIGSQNIYILYQRSM